MNRRVARLKKLFGIDFNELHLLLKLMVSMQVYAYTKVFRISIFEKH